jgi:16S rRNA (guanine(966)-N(2))-methyltransferase RsmD
VRIVAGTARGRPLLAPKGRQIRPTSDRVRESLFNVLGQWMDGLRVLDLYAGTGALALEALSRGAARAVLVDQDREAAGLCRQNAEALGFADRAEILALPVSRAAPLLAHRNEPFDLVFADPPYAARAVGDTLEVVSAQGLLAPGGTLVVEHDRRETAPERHEALIRVDQRRFGDTLVSLYRFA